jgi:CDP-6-deoxy-D-xylo-4-hexulose-3-dehydrase
MSTDSPFISDFRALLAKHGISHPRSAHGSYVFNPDKPSVLYSGPVHDTEEMVAAVEALVESRWSVAGEQVKRFEGAFARVVGNRYGVMTNSGSSANLILIAAAKERFGWEDGDEVITSSVGFPSTASVIPQNGLKPVWVDIEMDSLNLDLDEVEKAITGRTRAVFIAPVLGNPPDMDRLMEICREHGLKLLVDDCDGLGTKFGGVALPALPLVSASSCSFYPSHTISTTGGGMVTSNDEALIDIARSFASWGKGCWCSGAGNLLPNGCCGERFSCWLESEPGLIVDHRYTFPRMGWNALPLELQGAMGLAQLVKLPDIISRRRAHYEQISQWLYAIPGVRGVKVEPKAEVSWFGVPIVADTQEIKEVLLRHLEANRVQTRGYFAGNLLAQRGFAHLGNYRDYPNASQVLRRVFFIGCAPSYTSAHLAHVEHTLASFVPPSPTSP